MTSALFGRLRLFWRNIDPMVPMTLVGAVVGFIAAIAVEGFRQAMYAVMRLYSEQEHLVAAAAGLPICRAMSLYERVSP